jgi:hypothetical protein
LKQYLQKALDLALRVYNVRPTITHAETVAMALAELGRCQEAVEWQEGAIRGAREGDSVKDVESMLIVLEEYRVCRP